MAGDLIKDGMTLILGTAGISVLGNKPEKIDAHSQSVEELCKKYNTDIKEGLSTKQAEENLKKYGPNTTKNLPECYLVRRDGELSKIMSEEITLGDLIYMNPSEPRIPADVRIIRITEGAPFCVESYFLYKDCLNNIKYLTEDTTSDNPLETGNLAFSGTMVFAGGATAMVVSMGEDTLLNDIGQELLVKPPTKSTCNYEQGFKYDSEDRGDMTISFHEDSVEKLCEMFNSDVDKGLTTEQAEKNQKETGKNMFFWCYKMQENTLCKRDGEYKIILTRDLTVGDIIKMKAPEIIPGDIRMIEVSEDCKVDTSGLTGESTPRTVGTECTHPNPIETTNLGFATCKLVQGSLTGIVCQVGKKSVIQRMPEPQPLW